MFLEASFADLPAHLLETPASCLKPLRNCSAAIHHGTSNGIIPRTPFKDSTRKKVPVVPLAQTWRRQRRPLLQFLRHRPGRLKLRLRFKSRLTENVCLSRARKVFAYARCFSHPAPSAKHNMGDLETNWVTLTSNSPW